MGCRVSVYRDPQPLHMAFKEKKPHSGENSIVHPHPKSQDFGSKEDIYFDSRAWLESDCEDDFFSVNGEFTPSRGSTPNYQTSTPSTPSLSKAFLTDKSPISKSEPSPTGRKKLAAFLQESLEDEQANNEQNAANVKVETNGMQKLPNGTPCYSDANSVCSSEVTQKTEHKNLIERAEKAMKCCLPGLA